MFKDIPAHTFSITLPSETTKEIIEWFELMDTRDQLSDELIGLVHNHIMAGEDRKKTFIETNDPNDPLKMRDDQAELQDDFLNRLYNWQDSNNSVFKDDKEQKKEKKKMFSI